MLRHRLGEGYGRPLSSLFTSTDWTKLEPWSWRVWKDGWRAESDTVNHSVLHSNIKADTAAQIVNGRLALRYTQRIWVPVDFQDPQWLDAIKHIFKICLKPGKGPPFGSWDLDAFSHCHWIGHAVDHLSEGEATVLRVRVGYRVRGYRHGGHGFELVWDTVRDFGSCDPTNPPNEYLERLERGRPKTRREIWDGWGPLNSVSRSEYRHPSSSAVLDD